MEKLPSETYRTLTKPGPIDAHIGARIRLRRKQLGITMPSLGEAIGVGFQQVHNFEMGKIRISAARLYYIANALDVPVAFFFEDVPAAITASALAQGNAKETEALSYELDALFRRKTIQLVRSYYEITDPSVREALFATVTALGASYSGRDHKVRPD